jgi:hypothetical protein
MISLRRFLGVAMLAVLVALVSFSLGSCGKNDLTGIGLDRTVLVKGAGPQGLPVDTDPDSAYKWAVNSIDSVVFTDDIDSTTLEVTSFQLADTLGRLVPGTIRFMPGNAYIHYTRDFPDSSFDFFVKDPPMGRALSKVYFVPNHPLHPHWRYIYTLTTGVRMAGGRFKRDLQSWSFTTGDSVAPPNPIWP